TIHLSTQERGPSYAIVAEVPFHKIEVVHTHAQTFLLATSNASPQTFYMASYPPTGDALSFHTLINMKENIQSWDYEAQTIAVYLEDQTTHLLQMALSEDLTTMDIVRRKSIPPHPFYQFQNPQICYSSKKQDILLWEPQIEGSSWIFSTLDSQYWYALNLSLHHVTPLTAESETYLLDELSQDSSFISLVQLNEQFEFHFIGTRFIEREMFDKWNKDHPTD
ncbi:MAG: hypothetical protein PHX86_04105, partial [Caldisericia bacterium]|nr:hypothetical protein [Caldisericia bacterium]